MIEVLGVTQLDSEKITTFNASENSYNENLNHHDKLSHFRRFSSNEQKEIILRLLNPSNNKDELRKIEEFLRQKGIDAIISGDFTVTSPLLKVIKDSLGLPTVTLSAGHRLAFESLDNLGFDKDRLIETYKQALAKVDLIIAPTRFEASRTMKKFDLPSNKMRVVFNGVDVQKIECLATESNSSTNVLNKYGVKTKEYFYYVGRLDSDKGIHIFPFLAKKMSDLIVMSGEHMYDAPCGQLIFKRIISYYGLESRIILTGFINNNEKYALIKNSIATIYPSTDAESFGLVPIESVAAGTPTILPEIGPFPEIAKKIGEMVHLYRPFDLGSLVKTTRKVKEQRSEQAINNGINAVKKYFDSSRMAMEVVKVIEEAKKLVKAEKLI